MSKTVEYVVQEKVPGGVWQDDAIHDTRVEAREDLKYVRDPASAYTYCNSKFRLVKRVTVTKDTVVKGA